MNYNTACKILQIDKNDFLDEKNIKKQYRILALMYHPDKNNSPDASDKFQEIHDAYEFLMKYEEFCHPTDNEFTEDMNIPPYISMLYQFINNNISEDSNYGLILPILNKISMLCEDKALETLKKIDKNILIKTYKFLEKYKQSFHYGITFIDKIKEIVKNITENDERIVLNPNIDDLLEQKLYKLQYNDSTYYVPLWHDELIFDTPDNQIYITCEHNLPDDITIDENNNIHKNIYCSLQKIWEDSIIILQLGSLQLPIQIETLHMKKKQLVRFANKGIPRMNMTNAYDISKISDIIVNIFIE